MQLISEAAQPDSIIFVMDGSIGQAAEGQANAFKEAVSVGSIILTKMDGAGKGGGALSAVAATGSPIAFIGTGEHMHDFEPFQAQSFIGKLLGMGDVSGLMEKFNDVAAMTSKEKTLEMAKRLEQGIFTLGDLKEQMQMMVNLGPMSKVLSMVPGMGGMMGGLGNGGDEDISAKMKSFVTCLDSLSRSELSSDGKSLTEPSRIKRITRGSGCKEEVILELMQHYRKFAQMIKKMGGNGGFMKNMMSAMGGGGLGGARGSPQMMQQMQNAMGGPGGMGGFDFSQMMSAMGGGASGPMSPELNKRRSRR
jgi:signal recognition particle subunit SRP54